MPQQPLPHLSSVAVPTVETERVGVPPALWETKRGSGARMWRVHPATSTFLILMALSGFRLLVYCVIARSFGGATHVLCNYDCAWYEMTARAGYDLAPHGDIYSNTANWAFFPLYPLLLATVTAIMPASVGMSWAGILLSTVCFAGFGTLGGLYLQGSGAGHTTWRVPMPMAWLGLVSLWPGDLYFAFPYSEALYALLMMASLLALTQRRVLRSALASAALTATRPPGVMMVPVIVADRLRYLWQHHRAGTLRKMPVTALSHVLLPVALAPLGLFAFMAYLRWHMGDGLAFIHVQATWNRHDLPPWLFLWDGLTANDWSRVLAHPARESLSVEASFGIAGLALALHQLLRRRFAEAWLIGASILVASSSGLQSMPRFVLTNPIVILALFRLGATGASPLRLTLIALALGLAQLLLVLAWCVGAPVLS
ncbi:hypothetical protein [Acidisoma sp.]|uniref:hypothetical protein n=1 Tax=Acidisoma sp. TaxID=1872115 RepID=UPI003B009418